MLFFPGKKKFWAPSIAPYYAAAAAGGGGTGTAPTLDGWADGYDFGNTTVGTNNNSITTTQTNDIIVVIVASANPSSAAPTVSSISGSSLTFTKHGAGWTWRSPSRGNSYGNVEIWSALAASTISSGNFTATLSGAAEAVVIQAFGVHGCNTTARFDPNGSLTTNATGLEGATPTVGGVSITNNGTFLFEVAATISNAGFVAYPDIGSGWSDITGSGIQSVGATIRICIRSQYRTFTTAQTGLSCAFGSGAGTGDWIAIADALTS